MRVLVGSAELVGGRPTAHESSAPRLVPPPCLVAGIVVVEVSVCVSPDAWTLSAKTR